MADIISKVNTVVLVMFENRSFDHMLGHLSFEGLNPAIDGLKPPLSQYQNLYESDIYIPYNLQSDGTLPFDLPHEFYEVAIQLAQNSVTNRYTMKGFVEAYTKATGINPNEQSEPMGFFGSNFVPMSSFLARNFCTCERWFASLPTSTEPNRTMAFCGDSTIFDTANRPIPIDDSIFDWLTRNGVRWRVYHDGLSFFILYPHLWQYVFSGNFRDYKFLNEDILNEPEETAPQVILIEPSYQDSPHIGDHPNDNHAPLPVGWGEEFLRRTYTSIIANSDKWSSTVMVVYYDEHGGFYDHVSPPSIPYVTTGSPSRTFDSLGPRITGIIASPFVKQGSICDSVFDHTSVLQFLAERFTPGTPYSPSIDKRSNHGTDIASISAALTNDIPWPAPVPPDQSTVVPITVVDNLAVAPTQPMAQSFESAALRLIEQEPEKTAAKFPALIEWKAAMTEARKT